MKPEPDKALAEHVHANAIALETAVLAAIAAGLSVHIAQTDWNTISSSVSRKLDLGYRNGK